MIIDCHCHVGVDRDGESLSFTGLKEKMDENGIVRAAVFPFSTDDESLIAQSLEILEFSKENDWVIPFLRFNPATMDTETLSNLLDMGFWGVKLHPSAQSFVLDDPRLMPLYEVLSHRKMTVLFHCMAHQDASSPRRAISIAKRFPDMRVIIGHFFGGDLSIMEEVAACKNVYTEISISCRTLRLNHSFSKWGFDRVLFGSDVPYDSQKVAILKVNEAELTPEQRDRVFFGAAKELFPKLVDISIETLKK